MTQNGCTERISSKRAGFAGGKKQPCRWCGKMPEGSRRTFCSDECVDQHKIRTQPGFAAEKVLERDKGICCKCGIDTVELFTRLRGLLWKSTRDRVIAEVPYHCSRYDWRDPKAPRTRCGHDACIEDRLAYEIGNAYGWHSMPSFSAEYVAACDAAGIPEKRRNMKRRLWEMDHIVPVVEGGGDCGLENLRTLCWKCHHNETAALAARRARARKEGA